MLIKSADDKSPAIAELEALLAQASYATKPRILQELKNLHAGIKGEKEAAYELDFNFAKNTAIHVIHDLRLEIDGRVAQIDHLFINRVLEVYVFETKNFSQGLSINERGEFMAWYGGKAIGIASPLSQNERHLAVLTDAFKSLTLPKRMGFTLTPTLQSFVLISKNAKISRPSNEKLDSSNVMKSDQFMDWFKKSEVSSLSLAKIVSAECVNDLCQQLVALHKPIAFNYRGKFGMDPAAPQPAPAEPIRAPSARVAPVQPAPTPVPVAVAVAPVAEASEASAKYSCAACGTGVPYQVAKFCWTQKNKFGGNVYCRDHQQTAGPVAAAPVPAPRPAQAPAQAPVRAPSPVPAPALAPTPVAAPAPTSASEASASKYTCAGCGCGVPYVVAKFCWTQKAKFGGGVFCRDCQVRR